MYKQSANHPVFGKAQSVIRTADGATIPVDPANTDYQEYLKWVAEGNEPLPADTPVLEQTSDNTFTVQL